MRGAYGLVLMAGLALLIGSCSTAHRLTLRSSQAEPNRMPEITWEYSMTGAVDTGDLFTRLGLPVEQFWNNGILSTNPGRTGSKD